MHLEIDIRGEQFFLLPEKALYWPLKRTLVIADLHLGKTGHFRKNGIAVPNQANRDTLAGIDNLISKYGTDRLIFLGDLFHSHINREWNPFSIWRETHNDLDIILTEGNHDIIQNDLFHDLNIKVVDQLIDQDLVFQHLPAEHVKNDRQFYIYGHVHPACKIRGKARQNLVLSCFAMKANELLLPAYGKFTGRHIITAKDGYSIYAISEDQLVKI